jgi:predicted MPP superfamily phosphohydrolase
MSKFSRLFFILAVIAVLSLGVFVVYEGMALAFNVNNPLFAALLSVLTLSFIASTILGNYFYNAFTRTYYLLSMLWIGFFTYAFLASLLFAIIVLFSPSLIAAGATLYSIALLISIYGVLHTRTLVTKEVQVSLPNLSPQWKKRKAVWISDIHFGQIYGSSYAEKLTAHIESLAPDIVFVGGDLFDGTVAPDVRQQVAPLARLTPPLGMYFITGNHEEYGDVSKFLSAVTSANMRILSDELITIDGLQIIGVDYKHTSSKEGFEAVLAKLPIDRSEPSLLLKHAPEHVAVAEAAHISLQISGHTHNGQMWPFGYIARMVHQGFAYGLKSLADMQVYVSSGAGSWGPPMRVGTDSEVVLFTFK